MELALNQSLQSLNGQGQAFGAATSDMCLGSSEQPVCHTYLAFCSKF